MGCLKSCDHQHKNGVRVGRRQCFYGLRFALNERLIANGNVYFAE